MKTDKISPLFTSKTFDFSNQSNLFEYLNENFSLQKDGMIYFHIPFCENICSFCSMNRSKLDDKLDEHTKHLLKQIEIYSKFPYIKQKNLKVSTLVEIRQQHLNKNI